jgi:hypothetical protein
MRIVGLFDKEPAVDDRFARVDLLRAIEGLSAG